MTLAIPTAQGREGARDRCSTNCAGQLNTQRPSRSRAALRVNSGQVRRVTYDRAGIAAVLTCEVATGVILSAPVAGDPATTAIIPRLRARTPCSLFIEKATANVNLFIDGRRCRSVPRAALTDTARFKAVRLPAAPSRTEGDPISEMARAAQTLLAHGDARSSTLASTMSPASRADGTRREVGDVS
jgi:hypothetical protein